MSLTLSQPPSPPSVTTIGFDSTSYSAAEDANTLQLRIAILNGTIADGVTLNVVFSTGVAGTDTPATGTYIELIRTT